MELREEGWREERDAHRTKEAWREKRLELGEDLNDLAQIAKDGVKEQIRELQEQGTTYLEAVEGRIRQKPLQALCLSAGIGIGLGLWLARR